MENKMDIGHFFDTPQKIIMDPVHGPIGMYEHEVEISQHPLFQRMSHVRQNDVLFKVFPGATHSRFSHSLGTMHLASELFSKLVSQYLQAENGESDSHPLEDKNLREAVKYIFYCIRLAAMLHDTGHGPFSHLLESTKKIKEILTLEKTLETLWKGDDYFEFFKKNPKIDLKHKKPLTHEHYSIRCAVKILKDIGCDNIPVELRDVIGMMELGKINPSNRLESHAKVIFSLIEKRTKKINTEIKKLPEEIIEFGKRIISGEVDVDKMDYMLRDSYFSGCMYGQYNVGHLINSISIGFDFKDSEKPWIGLTIKEKALGTLENFIHARFQLYLHLYNHRKVVGFKWLFMKAIAEICEKGNFGKIREGLDSIKGFEHLTDHCVWEEFRNYAKNETKSACFNLLNSKNIEYVYSLNNPQQCDINNEKEKLNDVCRRRWKDY